MAKQRGLFITIEGGEGVGKSTNLEVLKTFLREHGVKHIQTREPGGTLIAEQIRDLLLSKQSEPFDPTAELLLIFAARAQHLNQLIAPTLDSGKWVLCDRFTDATYAYQGAGRKLDTSLIARLEELVQKSLRPDLTIILDLDPEIGLERARLRGELDRIESEQLSFFRSVRESYLSIAERDQSRCVIIDAAQDKEQVSTQLRQALISRLEAHLP